MSLLNAVSNPEDFDIDPTTGFISYNRIDAFSVTKKVEFLRLYRQNLNMTKSAEMVGSLRQTIMDHMRRDKLFAQAVTQAKLGIGDQLVDKAREVALTDEGVRDRWSLIERLNPEEYGKKEQAGNAQIVINIDGKTLAKYEAEQQSIDAEIISSSDNKSYISHSPTERPTIQHNLETENDTSTHDNAG